MVFVTNGVETMLVYYNEKVNVGLIVNKILFTQLKKYNHFPSLNIIVIQNAQYFFISDKNKNKKIFF